MCGGEELKWRQLKHDQLMSPKDLILVHTVQLKPTIKAQISGRMASIGTNDVVIKLISLSYLITKTPFREAKLPWLMWFGTHRSSGRDRSHSSGVGKKKLITVSSDDYYQIKLKSDPQYSIQEHDYLN